MLFEGQCEGLGPTRAARRFGYTKQRYFQLLEDFEAHGALALQSKAREPVEEVYLIYYHTLYIVCFIISWNVPEPHHPPLHVVTTRSLAPSGRIALLDGSQG
jgi:hypothetical protein